MCDRKTAQALTDMIHNGNSQLDMKVARMCAYDAKSRGLIDSMECSRVVNYCNSKIDKDGDKTVKLNSEHQQKEALSKMVHGWASTNSGLQGSTTPEILSAFCRHFELI